MAAYKSASLARRISSSVAFSSLHVCKVFYLTDGIITGIYGMSRDIHKKEGRVSPSCAFLFFEKTLLFRAFDLRAAVFRLGEADE